MVDRYGRARNVGGHCFGNVLDLVIPAVRSGVHGEIAAATVFGGAGHRPFDRTGHVAHVDEGPPGQAVAQHRDLPQGQRAGHEIVQHQIQAQPLGHAAGGRETQAGDDHVAAIHLRQGLLGPDLRARVGGQRIERI